MAFRQAEFHRRAGAVGLLADLSSDLSPLVIVVTRPAVAVDAAAVATLQVSMMFDLLGSNIF
jgi:hypothetical protein